MEYGSPMFWFATYSQQVQGWILKQYCEVWFIDLSIYILLKLNN
jgi:hypothetical protein